MDLFFGKLRDAVVGEDLLGEVAVALGDMFDEFGLELFGGEAVDTFPLVFGGDHQVDAVGVVADVLVQPGQLDLELFGGESDGAEDAETAGVADRGRHVAAVGEGEDGELDPQPVADIGTHGGAVSLWLEQVT